VIIEKKDPGRNSVILLFILFFDSFWEGKILKGAYLAAKRVVFNPVSSFSTL
jgi:hypothetical protein